MQKVENQAGNDTGEQNPCVGITRRRSNRQRLTFFKNQFKKDFAALFDGTLNSSATSTTDDEGNSEEEHKIFRYYDDSKDKNEHEGIKYINGIFWDKFEKKKKLGEGTSGVVRKCIRKEDGKVFAVKIVRTRDDEMIFHLKEEFINLSRLKHKNVIQVHELYIDKHHAKVFLLMEHAECKEMFDYIKDIGFYTEETAKYLFKELLIGIQYLHKQGVVHRDLKPNNILVLKNGEGVKICDFNVAKFFDCQYKDEKNLKKIKLKMYTYTGTLAFSAPEIFNVDFYTDKVDVWSAGCVLYTMLCGVQPFYHEYVSQLTELIKKGEYKMEGSPWNDISANAKDLIAKILVVDPDKRYCINQCLDHPWFKTDLEELPMHKKSALSTMILNKFNENVVKLCRKKVKKVVHGEEHIEEVLEDHHKGEDEICRYEFRAGCFNSMLRKLTRARRYSLSAKKDNKLTDEVKRRYYPSKTFALGKKQFQNGLNDNDLGRRLAVLYSID